MSGHRGLSCSTLLLVALGSCAPPGVADLASESPATDGASLVDLGEFEGTVNADGSVEFHPYLHPAESGQAVQALSTLDRTANNFTLTQTPTLSVNSRTTCAASPYSVTIPGTLAANAQVRCARITVTNNNATSTAAGNSTEFGTSSSSGVEFRRTYVEVTYLSDINVAPLGTEAGTDGQTGFLAGSPGHWYVGPVRRSGTGANASAFTMSFSTPAPATGTSYPFNIRVRVLADVVRPVQVVDVVSPSGATSDTGAYYARTAVSSDGRYIAWLASVTSATAPASIGSNTTTTASYQVFRRDMVTRTTTCATIAPNGTVGASASYSPTISPDGQYVFFVASGTTYGGSGTSLQIVARDMNKAVGSANAYVVLSRNPTSSTLGNADSYRSEVTGSGSALHVAFYSTASNLASDSTTSTAKVLYCEFNGTKCTSINLASRATGTSGAEMLVDALFSAVSSDGRYVVFISSRAGLGGTAPSADQVWLRDRTNNTTALLSGTTSGTTPTYLSGAAVASPMYFSSDSTFVGFTWLGANPITAAGSSSSYHVVVRPVAIASAKTNWVVPSTSSTTSAVYSSVAGLSSDARYIGVYSNDALTSTDTNGVYDYYVYDRTTSVTGRQLQIATTLVTGAAGSGGTGGLTGQITSDGKYLATYVEGGTLVTGITATHVYEVPVP